MRDFGIGAGPYPRAARLLALAMLFAGVTALWVNLFHVYQTDFISYWAASVLTLEGRPAAAYDVAIHAAVQAELVKFEGLMPFPYPPPFLFLLLPFGLLPYPVASALWIGLTFAFYLAVAKRVWPGSAMLAVAYPAVLANFIIGQNGFLTAALMIGGLSLIGKRPFVAGLVLGCLLVKPQLGILLPLALLAAGQWRVIAGAATSTLGLLLLGAIAFGLDSYRALFDLMPIFGPILSEGLSGWHKLGSVYASLRLAGLSSDVAWLLHILVAAAAALQVWQTWRADCPPAAKGAVLAAATFLISPYLYHYDSLILVIPFFWLLGDGADRRLLAALWCIPLVSLAQSWGYNETVNLMPLLPITLLVMIQRRLGHRLLPWPPASGRTNRPAAAASSPAQEPIKASTSRRLRSSSRNTPIIRLVVIMTPGVPTPRAVMQAWLASITTATPSGSRFCQMQSATCAVSRSWT